MSEDKTGKALERQVADLYRALGAWKVEHDLLMAGHQIDVYVEMAGPDRSLHRIAVEAKDWQSPVGIDVVGKWVLVVDDLRRGGLVDEGIIISPMGFTRPARREVAERVSRGLPVRLLELADLQASVMQTSAGVDLDQLREEYLDFLASSYHRLNFRGIVQTKNPVELSLTDVYVSLNVAPSSGGRVEPCEVMDEAALRERAERAERLGIEDVLREELRLVVLGDPGAGKTTFLRYVALALAEGEQAAHEGLGLAGEWLPIYLPLAAYNQELQQRRVSLEDYVLHYWDTRSFDRPGMDQLVARTLKAGQVLLLLDGLDEVGSRADRQATISQVETWANSYGPRGNRVVVTSRIVGYDEAPLACDFHAYTLSPFGPAEMERFTKQWCVAYQRWADPDQPEEMALEKGHAEAARLVAEIRSDPKVEALASNPLLITIIALIHYKGARLPDHRVELYDLCIKTLVETWREVRSEAGPVGEELRVANEIKVLAPFALWLQKQAPGPGGAARRDAVRARLVDLLARQFKGDREAATKEADRFLYLSQHQTGLLVERGEGWFGFFHPTFKEYLAALACVLEGQMKGPYGIWDVLRPHLGDALWHEVILLTVGYKAIIEKYDEAAAYLVQQIAAEPDKHGENVVLAGRCLADIGRGLVPDDCWDGIVEQLIPVMQDLTPDGRPHDPPRVPIPIRYAAAETLDRLGWLPQNLNAWGRVPGGSVYLHRAQCTESVPNFWMACYPVTNAQYERFIQAGGYDNPAYWAEETGARRWWEGTKRRQPGWWDDPRFGRSRRGYPVVAVNWYEALAYCAWLTDLLTRLRQGASLPPQHRELVAELWEVELRETGELTVTLPSEAEWVRAAGGEGNDDRYPWQPPAYMPSPPTPSPKVGRGGRGERLKLALSEVEGVLAQANVEESGLGHTTPVAMYPAGASPHGLMDLSGNVWEWTRDPWEEKSPYKALRGGAWSWQAESARVGSRLLGPPWDPLSRILGFRVCARWLSSGR